MTSRDGSHGTRAPSLRELLRSSTASLHRRVDAALGQLLREPDGGYERFLALSARAIFPIEKALIEANVAAVVPDWPQRSRAAALRSDLDALSIPAPAEEGLPSDPLLHHEAYQFGVLYVLEGSRLGARFILQELLKHPAPALAQANSYLSHGMGQPLWQTFLRQLEASVATRQRPDSAMAGAAATFEKFIRSSHQVLVHVPRASL